MNEDLVQGSDELLLDDLAIETRHLQPRLHRRRWCIEYRLLTFRETRSEEIRIRVG